MGTCKYCGQNAGLFHSKHDDCERIYYAGLAQIKQIINNCFITKTDFYLYDNEVKQIMQNSFISKSLLDNDLCSVFDEVVERYLEDGVIDVEEQKIIARFIQYSSISQAQLNQNRSLEKVLQSQVLQNILVGNPPSPRITINGDFPFLLAKNEDLVWLSRNITLYEQKVRKEYVGRSQGVSVRICKGVYYRIGGFKGKPIETSYMQCIGVGSVCLTTKHIYFSSQEKSLKIPYSKIISAESYSNGVGIQQEGANKRPVFFEGLNSWFTYNVIANMK